MGPGMRKIWIVSISLAGCLTGAGCIASGSIMQQNDQNECTGAIGFCSIATPLPRLYRKVPPPAGFSSTYQQYMLDRRRQARQPASPTQAASRAPASPAAQSARTIEQGGA